MRGLIGYGEWVIPISEATIGGSLANNVGPSPQLFTNDKGARCMMIFSDSDNLHAYREHNNDKGSQHFLSVAGKWAFKLPMEHIDELWIDPLSPHDIYYQKEQLSQLLDMANAIAVEEALVGCA